MDAEIIEVIKEQLMNEFPDYQGNMSQVAVRLYNIMRLEQPTEDIRLAREILKTVIKTME
jgi:hypothetical protein